MKSLGRACEWVHDPNAASTVYKIPLYTKQVHHNMKGLTEEHYKSKRNEETQRGL